MTLWLRGTIVSSKCLPSVEYPHIFCFSTCKQHQLYLESHSESMGCHTARVDPVEQLLREWASVHSGDLAGRPATPVALRESVRHSSQLPRPCRDYQEIDGWMLQKIAKVSSVLKLAIVPHSERVISVLWS